MRNIGLIELFLLGLLVFFVFNVWTWWNKGNIIQENTTTIIALATIVYAIFTFFMFWNMKSTSEAQVRPLLFSSLRENMDLRIVNKMKQNVAKNVKIRIRVIPISKRISKSRFFLFIHKYLWKPQWNFLLDYSKSFKENYEIWDDDKSLSLFQYIAETLFEKNSKWFNLIVQGKDPKEGETYFKLLVCISYESLLDTKYEFNEFYLVKKTPNGTRLYKNWDYH